MPITLRACLALCRTRSLFAERGLQRLDDQRLGRRRRARGDGRCRDDCGSLEASLLAGGIDFELQLSSGATELEQVAMLRAKMAPSSTCALVAWRPRAIQWCASCLISRSQRRARWPG
jgi:hypothetical protein